MYRTLLWNLLDQVAEGSPAAIARLEELYPGACAQEPIVRAVRMLKEAGNRSCSRRDVFDTLIALERAYEHLAQPRVFTQPAMLQEVGQSVRQAPAS
jgi:hypothetical protein